MATEAVSEMVASNNNVVSGFLVKDAEFLALILIGETIQTSTETVLHLNPILNAIRKRLYVIRDTYFQLPRGALDRVLSCQCSSPIRADCYNTH